MRYGINLSTQCRIFASVIRVIIGSGNGLSPACSAPSHYLNQCWFIVNWTLRNRPQWNFNRNSNIFIEENAFENVVWKMAAILSRTQCCPIAWEFPANTQRNKHVIITSKRPFYVMITCLIRCVFPGLTSGQCCRDACQILGRFGHLNSHWRVLIIFFPKDAI